MSEITNSSQEVLIFGKDIFLLKNNLRLEKA
jgi:hypothetical protein